MSESRSPAQQKTVAIISKPDRPELSEVLPALEKWLQARHYSVAMDEESAVYYPAPRVISRSDLGKFAPSLALVAGRRWDAAFRSPRGR